MGLIVIFGYGYSQQGIILLIKTRSAHKRQGCGKMPVAVIVYTIRIVLAQQYTLWKDYKYERQDKTA